ncbi:Carotenoid oxygenase [Penicillium argentinense]|uniref:Carotenoid oxygenase n=1 Tax=Penicillium argentinense TaxID=1131581 RepID=A0A9W9EXS0_9EURO|nr:Carotenoid oxygenase [Penicillium argentinense]KAJ5089973.1 Carotenoid oxygenase [Penicillium argentinense]
MTAMASGSKDAIEHWNNWPNEKGFDPEYEQPNPIELEMTGHIPNYAAGTLYRTGPGKSQVETEQGHVFKLSHWFDGFSQTHRFQIIAPDAFDSPLRILYNSRFSTDKRIEYIRKTGSLNMMSFGQRRDPCKALFNKAQSEFVPSKGPSTTNVGVTLSVNMPGFDHRAEESADRWTGSKGIRNLYAKTDYNEFKRLDPETLEPIGLATQTQLHPELVGPLTASHPRSDPVTGDVFNFNLEVGAASTYRVYTVSATTGKTSILATFSGNPAYLHSLLITEDYVLLCVWNSHINPLKLADGFFRESILPTDPSKPATWYVIDRKHGQGLVATYEGPAFFCFHTINAWQEPSPEEPSKIDIVADLVRMDTSDFIDLLYYEYMKSSLPSAKESIANRKDHLLSTITRFRLPALPPTPTSEIQKASVEWSACKELSPELPTMNPNLGTKRHRYIYSTTFRGEATLTDGIMKFDCDKQESQLWACHGHSPGEPIFVANPDGTSEDDGVLLSVVLDGMRGTSYLLCLDARNLKELGRAHVNGAIGFGFHGQHVPIQGLPTGDY